MIRSEAWRTKISKSVKKNWVIRRQKYGNKEGCQNPDEKNRKVGE